MVLSKWSDLGAHFSRVPGTVYILSRSLTLLPDAWIAVVPVVAADLRFVPTVLQSEP